MTLRWRLTLYYSAVSALILLAGGLAFFLTLRQNLRHTLDTSLQNAVTVAVSQLGGDEPSPKFSETEAESLLENLPGSIVLLVLDPKGQELDRVGTPRVKAPLVEGFTTFKENRVFAVRLSDHSWVQAVVPQVETTAAILRSQQLLIYGLPVLLLLGLFAGYLLADRALRPVDVVVDLAQNIANSGHYQERVPESPGKDEMARLTRTFNAMLARLEATIEREKTFALAAAHELRTPLTLLQGRAFVALKKERSSGEYREALRKIEHDSRELGLLVEGLLSLANTYQKLEVEPINLATTAYLVYEQALVEANGRGIDLHLQTQDAPALGNAVSLRLLTLNLVENALKYGAKGVWIRSGVRDGNAFLEVSDDGPGIPHSEIARLLLPFQRGLGLQGSSGSGIGLALVGAVAEQHRGVLGFGKSNEGGLLVSFSLPVDLK